MNGAKYKGRIGSIDVRAPHSEDFRRISEDIKYPKVRLGDGILDVEHIFTCELIGSQISNPPEIKINKYTSTLENFRKSLEKHKSRLKEFSKNPQQFSKKQKFTNFQDIMEILYFGPTVNKILIKLIIVSLTLCLIISTEEKFWKIFPYVLIISVVILLVFNLTRFLVKILMKLAPKSSSENKALYMQKLPDVKSATEDLNKKLQLLQEENELAELTLQNFESEIERDVVLPEFFKTLCEIALIYLQEKIASNPNWLDEKSWKQFTLVSNKEAILRFFNNFNANAIEKSISEGNDTLRAILRSIFSPDQFHRVINNEERLFKLVLSEIVSHEKFQNLLDKKLPSTSFSMDNPFFPKTMIFNIDDDGIQASYKVYSMPANFKGVYALTRIGKTCASRLVDYFTTSKASPVTSSKEETAPISSNFLPNTTLNKLLSKTNINTHGNELNP